MLYNRQKFKMGDWTVTDQDLEIDDDEKEHFDFEMLKTAARENPDNFERELELK
jgi:hypothetical protein